MDIARLLPDAIVGTEWFEAVVWPDGRKCPHCQGEDTNVCPGNTMLYRWCACTKRFRVRTGSLLQFSRPPLHKWVWEIYIEMTSFQVVSSMKLHRDLGVTQRTARTMLHRTRTAFAPLQAAALEGPVEADETYFGGLERNKHEYDKFEAGRGTAGKMAELVVTDRKTGQVSTSAVEDTSAVYGRAC